MRNRVVFRVFFLSDEGERSFDIPIRSGNLAPRAVEMIAKRYLGGYGIDASGWFCTGIEIM